MFGRKIDPLELLGHNTMGGRKIEAADKSSMTIHMHGKPEPFMRGHDSSNPRQMGELRVTKFPDASPFLYAQAENELQRTTVMNGRVRSTGLIAGLDRDRLRRLGISC